MGGLLTDDMLQSIGKASEHYLMLLSIKIVSIMQTRAEGISPARGWQEFGVQGVRFSHSPSFRGWHSFE